MKTAYVDVLADYFRAHPHQWVDGLTLAGMAGAYAWRSRVSDCRRRGLTIQNRQRKVGTRTVSEYRLVPDAPLQQPELFA
jgi:hypothetical protein